MDCTILARYYTHLYYILLYTSTLYTLYQTSKGTLKNLCSLDSISCSSSRASTWQRTARSAAGWNCMDTGARTPLQRCICTVPEATTQINLLKANQCIRLLVKRQYLTVAAITYLLWRYWSHFRVVTLCRHALYQCGYSKQTTCAKSALASLSGCGDRLAAPHTTTFLKWVQVGQARHEHVITELIKSTVFYWFVHRAVSPDGPGVRKSQCPSYSQIMVKVPPKDLICIISWQHGVIVHATSIQYLAVLHHWTCEDLWDNVATMLSPLLAGCHLKHESHWNSMVSLVSCVSRLSDIELAAWMVLSLQMSTLHHLVTCKWELATGSQRHFPSHPGMRCKHNSRPCHPSEMILTDMAQTLGQTVIKFRSYAL